MSEATAPKSCPASKSQASAPRRRKSPSAGARTPEPGGLGLLDDEDTVGIDYGPALAAVDDLARWAFDLAAKDVAEWPEGKRRVRNGWRYVHASLRGKRVPRMPREDLLFTAALLARIFDADIGLGLDHVAGILAELALPIDHAPSGERRAAVASKAPPITPSAWRHVRAVYHALPVPAAEAARDQAMRLSAEERDAWIDALTRLSVDDAAGLVLAYLRGAVPSPLMAMRLRRVGAMRARRS